MKIKILGWGPSEGVPTARFGYGQCDPNNPKNTRTRACVWLEDKDTRILFDTPPELREQLYRSQVTDVDAIVWTHMHADHVMGIDDARIFTRSTPSNTDEVKPLPVYISESDIAEFETRFSLYLKPFTYIGQKQAPFKAHLVYPMQPLAIKNLTLLPIEQNHGTSKTMGFKIGPDVAYNTDLFDFINYRPEDLRGIKLWILGCVSLRPNDKHLWLEKALQWFDIVKPERLILTHLGSKMDYDNVTAMLPKGVELAYDGMEIDL